MPLAIRRIIYTNDVFPLSSQPYVIYTGKRSSYDSESQLSVACSVLKPGTKYKQAVPLLHQVFPTWSFQLGSITYPRWII